MLNLSRIKCISTDVNSVLCNPGNHRLYPYLITTTESNCCAGIASPLHGRSIVVDYYLEEDVYIVTKGNGLTYFPYGFINTNECEDHIWGFQNQKSALRDFRNGEYIRKLGVSTNVMQAVYELTCQNIKTVNASYQECPVILQYSVKCPFRISDIPFLDKNTIEKYTSRWHLLAPESFHDLHCIAANILLYNLKTMHSNDVLHNAITFQNYTLMLELLDFEISYTPANPYESDVDNIMKEKLFNREIIQTLEIVNMIAILLGEKINNSVLKYIMRKYGYERLLQN